MAEPDRGIPKIDFVVAGVQKGGTQALQHFLSQHPGIGLVRAPKMAPHFFDRDRYFNAAPDYDEYHSWFSAESLARVTGDITPIYIYWKPCIERIKAYNPRMKVVVLLRNPVARAYSQWSMEYRKENERDPFWRAILMERFRRGGAGQHRVYSYLQRGFYSRQVERLLTHFPREQCLFVKSEALKQDHYGTLEQMFGFLGVSTTPLPPPEPIHAGAYAPMSALLRRTLTLYYRRDIRRLARLTGLDLSDWLS